MSAARRRLLCRQVQTPVRATTRQTAHAPRVVGIRFRPSGVGSLPTSRAASMASLNTRPSSSGARLAEQSSASSLQRRGQRCTGSQKPVGFEPAAAGYPAARCVHDRSSVNSGIRAVAGAAVRTHTSCGGALSRRQSFYEPCWTPPTDRVTTALQLFRGLAASVTAPPQQRTAQACAETLNGASLVRACVAARGLKPRTGCAQNFA
jgi:hypothetical protein